MMSFPGPGYRSKAPLTPLKSSSRLWRGAHDAKPYFDVFRLVRRLRLGFAVLAVLGAVVAEDGGAAAGSAELEAGGDLRGAVFSWITCRI
jgi:hypothetical protein